MLQQAIKNTEDVIDSRDVIERIEYLNAAALFSHELVTLKALAKECGDYSDWEHGEQLIRESYFVEYAQELAGDCGMVKETNDWPHYCIDWERAARELAYDYSIVEFDGVDYYIRSC
tara:strand:- start:196 stop:546 length:351 start_codon:yes stop_codon:yes gene_type:complete